MSISGARSGDTHDMIEVISEEGQENHLQPKDRQEPESYYKKGAEKDRNAE